MKVKSPVSATPPSRKLTSLTVVAPWADLQVDTVLVLVVGHYAVRALMMVVLKAGPLRLPTMSGFRETLMVVFGSEEEVGEAGGAAAVDGGAGDDGAAEGEEGGELGVLEEEGRLDVLDSTLQTDADDPSRLYFIG